MKMTNMLVAIATVLFAALTPHIALAQLIGEGSNEPIDITGDTAEFRDNNTIWTGNVRVIQGDAILTSEHLDARLNNDGELETIIATGSVRYSNGKESITGERAVFNDLRRTVTITRNVILTQGKQVMSAGKVTYWVDTGKVELMPDMGKRIRGLFFTEKNNEQS